MIFNSSEVCLSILPLEPNFRPPLSRPFSLCLRSWQLSKPQTNEHLDVESEGCLILRGCSLALRDGSFLRAWTFVLQETRSGCKAHTEHDLLATGANAPQKEANPHWKWIPMSLERADMVVMDRTELKVSRLDVLSGLHLHRLTIQNHPLGCL